MLLRWAVKTFDYLETNDPEHRKVQIGDRMESCDGGRYSRMRQQSH